MTTINVQELSQFQQCTSSSITGSCLKGTLYLITLHNNMEYKRGSVHLVDKVTKESIPCVVDRFFPSFHKLSIIIHKWNYIIDKTSGYKYVEFEMDQAFKRGTTKFSLLRNHFIQENEAFDSFKKESYHTPHKKLTSKENNIVGKVKAISSLFTQSEETSYFFVELTDKEGRSSVFIKFSGNQCINYYSYFYIGSIYVFKMLEWIKKDMFSFNETESTCCTITPKQYQKELIIQPHTCQSNVVTKIATYTGRITRIIDSLFGIYELDHKMILCLYHYLGYSPEVPFRIETKIRIHHFHCTLIQTNGNSNLLNSWQMKTECPVLISCVRTRIETLQYPIDCNVPIDTATTMATMDFKNLLYLDMIQRATPFSLLIRQLEIYATLMVKFKSIDWNGNEFIKTLSAIRSYVLNTTHSEFNTTAHGNLVQDFIHHDAHCSAIESDLTTHIMMDEYLELENTRLNLLQQLEPYQVDIAGGNGYYEHDNIMIRTAKYKQDKSFLIGIVEMTKEGRFVLKDDGASILFTTSAHLEINGIYIIRQAHMFEEDLSFIEPKTGIKQQVKSTYFTCDGKDIFLIRRVLTPKIQIQENFKPNQVIGFTCKDKSLQTYSVIHVIESFPIEIVLDSNGKLYMEARMTVELFSFDQDKKRKAILVISSKTNTLHYQNKLKFNNWCVISKLKKDEMIYFLDNEIHHLFTIDTESEKIPNATCILPIQKQSIKDDTTKQMYSVSQFTVESLLPDIRFAKKSFMFYNEPIDIKGIIISKKLTLGIGMTGILESQSMELYKEYGIGTGYFGRNIQIQLRQPDSLDFITIYIQVNKIHYPLGLIPGATVTFRNLVRKPSSNPLESYCSTLSTSTIQVETTRRNMYDISMQNVKVEMLSNFHQFLNTTDETLDRIFKTCCYIKSFIHVELKWKCRYCDSVILCNDCHTMCIDAPRVFMASVLIEISDGTTNAIASLDGERLVFRLLQLNQTLGDGLKRLAMHYGQIHYSEWHGCRIASLENVSTEELKRKQKQMMNGNTIDEIFSTIMKSNYIWIYGKLILPNLKRKRQLVDDLEVLEPNIVFQGLHKSTIADNNSILETWEFNKLKIKVFEIHSTDIRTQAYGELMNALSNLATVIQDDTSLPK